MDITYSKSKWKTICTDIKQAKRFLGGDAILAMSLLARINALESAENLHDIIVQPQFRFHNLHDKGKSKLEGYYAIDVKTKRDPWRIILQPEDENGPLDSSHNIHEVSMKIRIVEIFEVSKHYD